ncbi:hypothetical protein ACH5RR_032790 [Cinchona calisaya]|uniref:Neprosin PEP catalytic domain-containing protein n=1 Tax=Cinchona calisaya TaxID=153742 RepID=A0ABD2YPD9_9GENT
MMMALCNASRLSIASQNLKVKKHFSQLKKNPLKSIKSKDGDVIDCVHISQQPAFDNPLLENHNIQMRPNNYPELAFAGNKFNIKSNGVQGQTYYGAKASMNVWEPQVQNPNEFSSSQLWILGGDSSDINVIEAGWHVFPQLYGDNRTRLFIFWTADGYKSTGCYNLQCSGFVQTNNVFTLGGTLSPLSTFHGSQFEIDALIWKEPSQDAWWLQCNNIIIGYWPTSLFTSLANSAPIIEWGGLVFSSESDGQHTTTQMGSGHFPEEGFSMASYMKNLQVVDDSFTLRPLSYPSIAAEQPNCYNITLGKTDDWGDFIFFGGPGRNPNCP